MRNIRTFETYEDFLASQEAVSGSGEYVEDIVPGFVYIRDRYLAGEEYAFFNKASGDTPTPGGDYVFGDIIYTDGGSQLKSVYWSGWTESLGTPVGLVVIPTSMAPDGNARMIALTDIEGGGGGIKASVPDTNLRSEDPSSKESFYWENHSGNEPDDDVNWYDVYVISYPAPEGPSIIYQTMGLSDDVPQGAMSTDVSGVTENPIADGEYYTSLEYPPVVSPYMTESDEINPNYLQEVWPVILNPDQPQLGATVFGASYNALSDFSGLTWTKLLAENKDPYDAAQAFATSGTNAGDWYVPSLGEAGFLQARWRAITGILVQLFEDSETINAYPYEGIYYTSTLINCDGAKTGVVPFVYYIHESQEGGVTYGTSYPSDVPTPLFGGYDAGLTKYNVGGVEAQSIQPTKAKNSKDTPLGATIYTEFVYVRPMAMIKDGHIVTEVGTPEANNHQIKDLDTGGEQ